MNDKKTHISIIGDIESIKVNNKPPNDTYVDLAETNDGQPTQVTIFEFDDVEIAVFPTN